VTTVTQATPSVSIDANGKITASATQTAGYVSAGTKTGTKQLTVQAAKTVTPTKSSQTAVASGVYTTGAVTIAAIPDEYIDSSDATVTEDKMFKDETSYAKGKKLVGTFTLDSEMTAQDNLIAQIQSALEGKASGGSTGKPEQTKTVSITENGEYEILPDEGYTLSGVQVSVEVEGAETDDFTKIYQRVEYIESAETGTYPYILTDFIVDNTCGAEVIASFPQMQDRIPMGSRQDSNATRFYVVYPLSTSSVYYGFNTGASISCSLKVDTIYRLQTNFLNSRLINVYEQNGTRKASTAINATLTEHTVPLSIFGYNSGSSGAVTSKREYKFYGARCSRNHEVVREYIPCYRKSDGEVGLYEKFTKQFLTNASDSGSFAKGPDVIE
jgi:hypothetical protein